MILGHGKTTDVDLKSLLHMVRGEGFEVFRQWCKDYEIEVALGSVRAEVQDKDATGKSFVLGELAEQFENDVESRYQALEDKYK